MSLDIADLSTWTPTGENFGVHVRLLVGAEGEDGEDVFDLMVCNAGWLREQAEQQEVVDLRHHLLVERFDWPVVEAYLVRRVSSCQGRTWDEVAQCVSRLGYWEFEDYGHSRSGRR